MWYNKRVHSQEKEATNDTALLHPLLQPAVIISVHTHFAVLKHCLLVAFYHLEIHSFIASI